jgi:hypothetical protein
MIMKKQILFSALMVGIIASLYSQLTIDAEVRPRFEVRDGYQMLQPVGVKPAIFSSQRTRLTLNYETENLKIRIAPQDVRIWGDAQMANMTGVFGDVAAFDMYEGYVAAKVKNKTWISAGRQALTYDNQWLISSRGWNQNGSSIDALVLKTKVKKFDLHMGAAWNNNKEHLNNLFFSADRLKSLNYLWINRSFSDKRKLSLMYLATGVTKNDTSNVLYYRHTTGLLGEHKSDKLFASFNAYYQNGVNTKGRPVSAFLGAAEVKYKIKKFSPGATFALLSGNSKIGADMTTDNLFDILYGARHMYFGFMDYFRVFGPNTANGGLIDAALVFDYELSKKLSVKNAIHYFMLHKTNTLTGDDAELGFENDLVVKYKVHDWGLLELGYSFFIPSETLKHIQNVQDNKFSQFVYLQFAVKTNVFTQKKEN